MFYKSSRYTNCEDAQLVSSEGIINYKKRRFLPQLEKMSTIQEIQVISGDRLDLISTKVTGDPQQFWYICDSNNSMNPMDLVEVGKMLRIATQ